MKKWWLFVSLVMHMFALWRGLTALKFSFTWVRHKGPQDPQIWKKKLYIYFFHILGLNLKISYQIVSLFDMYIDMGERIAGKQDRPSPIVEDPLRSMLWLTLMTYRKSYNVHVYDLSVYLKIFERIWHLKVKLRSHYLKFNISINSCPISLNKSQGKIPM